MQRPDANEELSRRIAQTLRAQPLERAPDTLIARVQREIARREGAQQTLPWWRQSLAHWPLGARLGFIAASLACALLLTYVIAPVQRDIAQREAARQPMLPWWRQSLAHWPLGARLGFVAASLACALLLAFVIAPDASAWATRTADSLLARPAGALQGVSTLLEFLSRLSRHALDAVLLFYGTLFGLLAVAHALLYGGARAMRVRSS